MGNHGFLAGDQDRRNLVDVPAANEQAQSDAFGLLAQHCDHGRPCGVILIFPLSTTVEELSKPSDLSIRDFPVLRQHVSDSIVGDVTSSYFILMRSFAAASANQRALQPRTYWNPIYRENRARSSSSMTKPGSATAASMNSLPHASTLLRSVSKIGAEPDTDPVPATPSCRSPSHALPSLVWSSRPTFIDVGV